VVEDDGGSTVDGQELIERLCDTYLRRLLATDRASRQSGEESGDVDGGLLDVAEDYADDYYSQRVEIVEEIAQQLLSAEQADLTGTQLRALLNELLRTRVVAMKAAISERDSDAAFDPRSVQLQRPSSLASAAPDPAAIHTIGELSERYLKHQRETGAWKVGKVEQDRGAAVVRFVEWLGGSTPLADATPERCQGVFEFLSSRKLAPTTQNKELRQLRALFNYGIKLEWMQRNPAQGLKVKEPPAREQRLPLNADDLRRLFGPAFVEAAHARPVGGAAKKGGTSGRVYMPERYWCPLLSLYTGLRLGEVLRLRPSSIQTVDNVLCVVVEPDQGDSLKTESSQRLVPVHPQLVALGFVEFVEEQRLSGEQHLFTRAMQLKKPDGTLTSWFPRYRRSVGVSDKRKSFHSLRHTFRQRLADQDVQDSVLSDLLGHVDETMTHGRYGSRANVTRLRDAVERLDFSKEVAALAHLPGPGGSPNSSAALDREPAEVVPIERGA
jgi:integrase